VWGGGIVAKISVCAEMFFPERPFLDRLAKLAEMGFREVEFWDWPGKDIEAIVAAQGRLGLKVVAFGAGCPSLVDPAQRRAAIETLRGALNVAERLGCRTLIILSVNHRPTVPTAMQRQSLVDGLRALAPLAEERGVTLALEPLNTVVDHVGHFLNSSREGFAILEEVGSPGVKLLYDCYHMQIMEGNLVATISQHIGEIAHFHVADVPGRHEPGTGELNYANIVQRIGELGYAGYVGLEYVPTLRSDYSIPVTISRLHPTRAV